MTGDFDEEMRYVEENLDEVCDDSPKDDAVSDYMETLLCIITVMDPTSGHCASESIRGDE